MKASPITMQELKHLVKRVSHENKPLPFSVLSSFKEQRILNVPILKPLLIVVLTGAKVLGQQPEATCASGNFLFLSNSSCADMRNIPDGEYFAILIEFEVEDFNQFTCNDAPRLTYFTGTVPETLVKALNQYVEWSSLTPKELWHARRKEILNLLYLSGHEEIAKISGYPSLSHKLHKIISEDASNDWSVNYLANKLAVSQSTLRRKLRAEGGDIKTIVNQARMSKALFLVQTTMESIGHIAERCGYKSQSRFTMKFKSSFGVTPTSLRNTRLRG
ncbi:helix-turn-helix transcriptional regulator [Pseudomonas sp. Sample_16]|uniref:helix-turn-helix transcriptional regulator n=1 Tax=Pseudomonas sp. Sample_16 TaxID=2448263 RepID=UPI001F4F1E5D|nr:helix-turn-helix transcriptional regulator [Pseudomonas sp. Sample_16]